MAQAATTAATACTAVRHIHGGKQADGSNSASCFLVLQRVSYSTPRDLLMRSPFLLQLCLLFSPPLLTPPFCQPQAAATRHTNGLRSRRTNTVSFFFFSPVHAQVGTSRSQGATRHRRSPTSLFFGSPTDELRRHRGPVSHRCLASVYLCASVLVDLPPLHLLGLSLSLVPTPFFLCLSCALRRRPPTTTDERSRSYSAHGVRLLRQRVPACSLSPPVRYT